MLIYIYVNGKRNRVCRYIGKMRRWAGKETESNVLQNSITNPSERGGNKHDKHIWSNIGAVFEDEWLCLQNGTAASMKRFVLATE